MPLVETTLERMVEAFILRPSEDSRNAILGRVTLLWRDPHEHPRVSAAIQPLAAVAPAVYAHACHVLTRPLPKHGPPMRTALSIRLSEGRNLVGLRKWLGARALVLSASLFGDYYGVRTITERKRLVKHATACMRALGWRQIKAGNAQAWASRYTHLAPSHRGAAWKFEDRVATRLSWAHWGWIHEPHLEVHRPDRSFLDTPSERLLEIMSICGLPRKIYTKSAWSRPVHSLNPKQQRGRVSLPRIRTRRGPA